VLQSQHHVMVTQQHILHTVFGIVCVVVLALLDAATATQVIYSASSDAEKIKGPMQSPWKICSVYYTVRKSKYDAGPKHECDRKFSHPHRFSGPIYNMWVTDFSDRSMWMTEFSVTHMSCVMLGFPNSVYVNL
jgi:hypothetical protein